jgi:translation elongation factor EF-4
MELGTERRGIFKDLKYLTPQRSSIVYEVCLVKMQSYVYEVHQLTYYLDLRYRWQKLLRTFSMN